MKIISFQCSFFKGIPIISDPRPKKCYTSKSVTLNITHFYLALLLIHFGRHSATSDTKTKEQPCL